MYGILKRNWKKTSYFGLLVFIITVLLLVAVAYKSDKKIVKKSDSFKTLAEVPDIETFKNLF